MAEKTTVSIRLDTEIHARLKRAAKAKARSISNFVTLLITDHLDKKEK